ncbi:Ser/Thr phosphatase [Sphingobacterium sp. SGG-5]|uniref:calcineurin-like phosphoesterase C-terminal domain-containing protein n=1 Tax=Sphingobacterium sp. SGG-5 TaxID=2710881 RepID=UPI0013EA6431|nr:calcineurin-like phosphoesterase family protein [Sphingobacterium sp. SGG-5]NGM61326.1 Ser/Thr phosphatase [Sphingobacterium sp. SGG-5]
MKKQLLLFTYLISLLPVWLSAQVTVWMEGTVFHDKNQNKVFDRGEKGVKKIAVSNGKDIVYTDSKGYFRISATVGQSIFPIIPTGYTFVRNKGEQVNNSFFIYLDNENGSRTSQRHNFGLIPEKQSSSFRIGAIGDVQVGDSDEINYAGKTIFKELADRQDIAFHLILGDLVNDDMRLLAPFKAMLNMLPSPSWTVLGNHDRNTEDTPYVDDRFNEKFGASTYAFNYGGVHFIVLQNVFSTGKRSYEGRISEEQLQFLTDDLKNIPTHTQVVICQHIPMRYTRNRTEVLTLLEPFSNVLILSGHTHQVSRHFYNQGRVQELVTGAPSGNWWTGETNMQGIPEALMQCGSPRNYFTVDFDKNNYTLRYKGIGLDKNQQMDVTLRGDTLLANLYGGSDSTQVYLQIGDSQWMPMEHVKRPAESVLQLIENNKQKRFPASGKRINPLRKRMSPHIWQAATSLLSPGTHRIRIKAHDNFGYAVETTETFYVKE